jgi:hypothetical protein
MLMRTMFTAAALAMMALTACPTTSTSGVGLDPNCDQTAQIYERLRPDCVACHDAGTNQPFFSSQASFRALLAANPLYVVPGNPDGSELIALLQGTGTRTFAQMPTAGEPWAQLSTKTLSIDDVRAWITTLQAQPRSSAPDAEAPTTRRLRAEEIVSTLQDGLGLVESDWVQGFGSNFTSVTAVLGGDLPVYSPDRAPGLHYGDQRLDAGGRWRALGGPQWLDGAARTRDLTPSTVQALAQLAHGWCRMAVRKQNNAVLFGTTSTAADTVASNAVGIRSTVAALQLRLLGVRDDDAALDALLADVMTPAVDAEAAWVGVCAAVALDPRFLAW